MKKLNKKFELNKKVVANLCEIKGGKSVNTIKCASQFCAHLLDETRIFLRGACAVQTIDFECDYSNQNCNTDFTCTPSNWGHDCL